MTCVQCESDTADRKTYVTYGGFIWCNLDCLAEWVVENEDQFDVEEKIERIEDEHEVIEQYGRCIHT